MRSLVLVMTALVIFTAGGVAVAAENARRDSAGECRILTEGTYFIRGGLCIDSHRIDLP